MDEFRASLRSARWQSPRPGLRYKAVEREGKRLRMMELSKGFKEAVWCYRSHFGLVLKGEMEVAFGRRKTLYREGDAIAIPGGEASRHKARPLSPIVKLFLVDEV